jgi:eukaryotic-like serine/threonine-protein kinase
MTDSGPTPTPGDAATTPQPEGFTPYGAWERIVQRLREATIGEFEIRRELGRGGMAIVFLAHDIHLRRKVALKLMSPGLLTNDEMVRKFGEEAITVAQLGHPNIITIHGIRNFQDLHFFIMQFVEGQSLDHVLRETGALPIPVVRGILHQVGNALMYAHRRGVIHRDIKPGNVLIDVEGNALVTDFGIAKAIDSATHTKTGTLVGTAAYMSPEQCYGLPATWASDLYSLGVVAYEMITGAPPFKGSSFAVMQAHAVSPVPPMRDVRPDCPPELEAAVLRMLVKEPADRWPSIAEALSAAEASPLPENDPSRLHLGALVREAVPIEPSLTPVSPIPALTRAPTAERAVPPPPAHAAVAPVPVPQTITAETTTLTPVRRRSAWALGAVGAAVLGAAAILLLAVLRRSPATTERAVPAQVAADTNATIIAPSSPPATAPTRADSVATATAKGTPAPPPGPDAAIPARVRSVVVAPAELTLTVGETSRPSASVLGEDNRPLAGRRVVWLSPNAAVATVDSGTGAVTAVGEGTAEIRATSGGVTGTLLVRVNAPVVLTSIVVDPPRRLTVGESLTMSATPRDSRGNPMTTTNGPAWSSADPAVATVNPVTGVVTATGPGVAEITASVGGKSATVPLTVVAAAPPPAKSEPKEVTPDPAVEERRARTQMETAVQDYVTALRGHDVRRITALYHAESEMDRKNQQSLLRLLEAAAKLTTGLPQLGTSRADGSTGSMDFAVPLTWRTPFGPMKSQTVTFRADFQRDGSEWRVATTRLVGAPFP